MKSKVKLITILLVLSILSFSCNQEEEITLPEDLPFFSECNEIVNLGSFLLHEESKAFIPYSLDTRRLVFVDEGGKTYTGNVIYYGINLVQDDTTLQCEMNEMFETKHSWNIETKSLGCSLSELSLSIFIHAYPSVNKSNIEEFGEVRRCVITQQREYLQTDSGVLKLPLEFGNYSDLSDSFTDFFNEIEIQGQMYKNVYYKEALEDYGISIYYSLDTGIIGFGNISHLETGSFLKFKHAN